MGQRDAVALAHVTQEALPLDVQVRVRFTGAGLVLEKTVRRADHAPRALGILVELGARPADIGQTGEEPWHVLADPEGNEFCLLKARLDPL